MKIDPNRERHYDRLQSELVIKKGRELGDIRHLGFLRGRGMRRNRWGVRGAVVPSGLVPAYGW